MVKPAFNLCAGCSRKFMFSADKYFEDFEKGANPEVPELREHFYVIRMPKVIVPEEHESIQWLRGIVDAQTCGAIIEHEGLVPVSFYQASWIIQLYGALSPKNAAVYARKTVNQKLSIAQAMFKGHQKFDKLTSL